MKKALMIAVLGVFLAAGVASAHMMGRHDGHGMRGYGMHVRYSEMGFQDTKANRKFLEESYLLRKEMNEKRFELREAMRLDQHGKADKLKKDIRELSTKVAKIAKNNGWEPDKRRGDCRGRTW